MARPSNQNRPAPPQNEPPAVQEQNDAPAAPETQQQPQNDAPAVQGQNVAQDDPKTPAQPQNEPGHEDENGDVDYEVTKPIHGLESPTTTSKPGYKFKGNPAVYEPYVKLGYLKHA
jgi:hypothetical protein